MPFRPDQAKKDQPPYFPHSTSARSMNSTPHLSSLKSFTIFPKSFFVHNNIAISSFALDLTDWLLVSYYLQCTTLHYIGNQYAGSGYPRQTLQHIKRRNGFQFPAS